MPSYNLQELYHDLREGVPQLTAGRDAGVSGLLPRRKLITEQDRSIRVPQDEPTILDALEELEVPLFYRHNHTIWVDPAQGPYPEDVYVPAFYSVDRRDDTQGANAQLKIRSQTGGTRYTVDSCFVQGPNGVAATNIVDMAARQANPFQDEGAQFCVHGGAGQVSLYGCAVSGSTRTGFTAKGGRLKIDGDTDLGTDNVEYGFEAKNGGRIGVLRNGSKTGSTTNYVYRAGDGWIFYPSGSTSFTGANGVAEATGGFVVDGDTRTLHDTKGADSNFWGVYGTPTWNVAAPDSGMRMYYRGDLSPPELRAIDENGNWATLATF